MGEAALVIRFHQRAGGDVQAQRNPLRRLGVRIDDVAQAVVQGAEGGAGVRGDVRGRLRPRAGRHFGDGGVGLGGGWGLGAGVLGGVGVFDHRRRSCVSGVLVRAQRKEGRGHGEDEDENKRRGLLHGGEGG